MSTPTTATGTSCVFCGSPAVWNHPLDPSLTSYRKHGKGHTLPSAWALCDGCEQPYATGDDDGAVHVMRASAWTWVDDAEVDECLRKPLAVFRRADLGAQLFDPEDPLVTAARAERFVPLRELTGAGEELGPAWPPDHARWVEELGPTSGEDEYDEPDRWMVRSPWPPISVAQVLAALWNHVDPALPRDLTGARAAEAQEAAVREFFSFSEPDVRALLPHTER